jgi:hypothetical protein
MAQDIAAPTLTVTDADADWPVAFVAVKVTVNVCPSPLDDT